MGGDASMRDSGGMVPSQFYPVYDRLVRRGKDWPGRKGYIYAILWLFVGVLHLPADGVYSHAEACFLSALG